MNLVEMVSHALQTASRVTILPDPDVSANRLGDLVLACDLET